MKIDINITNISKAVGIIVAIGGPFYGLFELLVAEKLQDINLKLVDIEAKQNMLLEERLIKMQKNELYERMKESLRTKPSRRDTL